MKLNCHPESLTKSKKSRFALPFRRHSKKSEAHNDPQDDDATSPPSVSSCPSPFIESASIHSCKSLMKGSFSENDVQHEGYVGEQVDASTSACSREYHAPAPLDISAVTPHDHDELHGVVLESHSDFYSDSNNLKTLQEGGVLFSFSCPHSCNDFEEKMVDCAVNLTNLPPEYREELTSWHKYTVVLSRCSYLLPGVDIEKMCNPEFLASEDYHHACQPTGTKVWEPDDKTTIRITKPVIPHLFYLTVQFKVSKVNESDLDTLSALVGTPVHGALLLERTKRNAKRKDPTRMGKSILLYTKVKGGILVNRITVVLQSSIPLLISMAMNKFGSLGLGEACETVKKTREYTRASIPMLEDDDNAVQVVGLNVN